MNKPVVIIACGKQKLDHRAPAAELYTGTYFRLCLAYARTLAADEDIFILSAKHGLLRLTDEIEPYNLRIEIRAWDYIKFQAQIDRAGLRDRDAVTTAGGAYRTVLYHFFAERLQMPLNGRGGIGKQMAWLKQEINKNRA